MKNTEHDNMDFGTGRRDEGYGTCRVCAEYSTDIFFANKIEEVRKCFEKPENLEKFDKASKEQKINFIIKMIDEGVLTFKIKQ